MKQYKCVAGPKSINVEKGDVSLAFNMFADIINGECAGGWTYHSMEKLAVSQKKGCLFNAHYETTNFYMLIFEKEV